MHITNYIFTAPQYIQDTIKDLLYKQGLSESDIEIAMAGRFCDLEDSLNTNC